MAEVSTKKTDKKSWSIPLYSIAIAAFILVFGSFVAVTVAFRQPAGAPVVANGLTKEEVELLVKEMNPMQVQSLAQDKTQLTDQLRNIFAIAREGHRSGVTSNPEVQRELKFIEVAITANNYDQNLSDPTDGPSPTPRQPFGDVTEEQVKDFWAGKGTDGATKESRDKEFKDFIAGKIALQKASGQMPEDQPEPTEEELKPIRDNYARTFITYEAAKKKFKSIPGMKGEERDKWTEIKKKNDLDIKMQQTQFIAAYFSQTKLKDRVEPTEEEIKKYLADNPELGDEKSKEKKAIEVIEKLDGGGDFAELAKEFSEDPGSKDNGGLYEEVPLGRMNKDFETAALALEPGTYTKKPVKTNFGYHVIKLESVSESKDAEGNAAKIYNVRHILISTQISDPENPFSPPMSAEDFVKAKLSGEKEKAVLDEIIAKNPVTMPSDFDLPKLPEGGMQLPNLPPGMQQGPPPPRAQPQPQPQPQPEN